MKKTFFLLMSVLFFLGCIRLAGKAGYWHQGKEDEMPTGKVVGFDTENITR